MTAARRALEESPVLPERTLMGTEKEQGRKEVPLAGDWVGVGFLAVAHPLVQKGEDK